MIAATLGLLASLLLNLGASFQLALNAASPAFPHIFDQRYLIVSTWGFIVPDGLGFQLALVARVHGIAATAELFLLVALRLNTTV